MPSLLANPFLLLAVVLASASAFVPPVNVPVGRQSAGLAHFRAPSAALPAAVGIPLLEPAPPSSTRLQALPRHAATAVALVTTRKPHVVWVAILLTALVATTQRKQEIRYSVPRDKEGLDKMCNDILALMEPYSRVARMLSYTVVDAAVFAFFFLSVLMGSASGGTTKQAFAALATTQFWLPGGIGTSILCAGIVFGYRKAFRGLIRISTAHMLVPPVDRFLVRPIKKVLGHPVGKLPVRDASQPEPWEVRKADAEKRRAEAEGYTGDVGGDGGN